ncbi:DUF177 domain-containing protein [Novosphingobium sp. ERN07]|uniref:YceD family protein n=1 Tax=Novosphingobium sp. ERN07 TaxID=2726187 RepID=UPI00145643A6|nr:DUF177 domain-containing protein [Novosphingobium sp. ERN07]NLR72410.1 DUF177 domain-containing protein [Novosphingobium sp. ERN07]
MSASEFSRVIDIRQITDEPVVLVPDDAERRRLAGRFGISAIDDMRAELHLSVEGHKVDAKGRLTASIMQACAISGEDFPVKINELIALRFVPPGEDHAPDEEIEITADDCDEIEYEGMTFDLGEAVAQSLALAIDPFAEGPDADKARAEHNLGGDVASGPFAALAALKKD